MSQPIPDLQQLQIQQPLDVEQQEQPQDSIIQLQGSLVNKLIKRIFPEKIVTSDFKKEFSKMLSIFILYVQSGQEKKKYGEADIIAFLERQFLGKVAQDLRNKRKTKVGEQLQKTNRKQQPQVIEVQQVQPVKPVF